MRRQGACHGPRVRFGRPAAVRAAGGGKEGQPWIVRPRGDRHRTCRRGGAAAAHAGRRGGDAALRRQTRRGSRSLGLAGLCTTTTGRFTRRSKPIRRRASRCSPPPGRPRRSCRRSWHNEEATGVARRAAIDFGLLACDEVTGLVIGGAGAALEGGRPRRRAEIDRSAGRSARSPPASIVRMSRAPPPTSAPPVSPAGSTSGSTSATCSPPCRVRRRASSSTDGWPGE